MNEHEVDPGLPSARSAQLDRVGGARGPQIPLESRNVQGTGPITDAPHGTTIDHLLQPVAGPDPSFVHLGNLRVERALYPQFEQAERYLARAPEAISVLYRLEHTHPPVSIVATHDGNDAYDPGNRTVYWDPRSPMINLDGTRQTAALGLLHEQGHAYEHVVNPARFNGDGMRPNKRYDDAEEQRNTVGLETRAARLLGEGTRRDHMGVAYHARDPVSLQSTGELDHRATVDKLNDQIRQLSAHGYSTLRQASDRVPAVPWDHKLHTGSFVHVDSHTAAQFTGRGYQLYDVERDLGGRMPPENVPGVTVDARGTFTVPAHQHGLQR